MTRTHRRYQAALTALGRGAVSVAGRAVGVLFGVAGRVRGGKPLHPRGRTYEGTLTVWGSERAWGVPLLDTPGETPCLVRLSRAGGLPEPLPDVHGIAVRLEVGGSLVDLLLGTTGVGTVSRFVLVPRFSGTAPMTTLLPVRSPAGLIVLRVSPEPAAGSGGRAWRVSVASPRGAWAPVGRLETRARPVGPDPDPPVRFDPVRHLADGMTQLPWVRLLRDPSYVLARRWAPSSRWRPRPRAGGTPRGDSDRAVT